VDLKRGGHRKSAVVSGDGCGVQGEGGGFRCKV
jgi:hypothetical protein